MKTAIEQIKEKLKNIGFMNIDEFFVEFLETEKHHIIEANRAGVDMVLDKKPFITGEQYYNETFKN